MDQIAQRKDDAIEKLLSVSAEMATFIKRSEWKHLDRLAAERSILIEQLNGFQKQDAFISEVDKKRWAPKLIALERLNREVVDLIQKYQSHIQRQMKSMTEEKILLVIGAQLDPKGHNLSTRC